VFSGATISRPETSRNSFSQLPVEQPNWIDLYQSKSQKVLLGYPGSLVDKEKLLAQL
jgi:hypothetical protein